VELGLPAEKVGSPEWWEGLQPGLALGPGLAERAEAE